MFDESRRCKLSIYDVVDKSEKCFPFLTSDEIIHALTAKNSPSSKRIFNLSTRNQKNLNFIISVTFFSILSLIFIFRIFEKLCRAFSEKLFDLLTNGFNVFHQQQRREIIFMDVNFEIFKKRKLGKSLNKTPTIYHDSSNWSPCACKKKEISGWVRNNDSRLKQ